MRIALGITYDGSGFDGWQTQPSRNTVQDRIEAALAQITGHAIRITGAGRTDAGVHAVAQVAHFDTDVERPASAWVRGTNTYLPGPIAVQWGLPVPDEFHARFSATARRYLYVLYNHPVRPSVLAGRTGWFHAPLDVDAMREAAASLVGRHDFSAFRSSECQAKTPVRHVSSLSFRTEGHYVVLEITADAFLHHMVRNIVGALVQVGSGRRPRAWLSEVLKGRDRTKAAPTAMADGLYLAGVQYESRWRLPVFPRMIPFLHEN